ncbi:hypothetical protein [Candidatus Cardinium hertigii]|uniref:hypothetical protein n=1 Tax=Candidatus Cardinium hertigii TaxID=247481 RepID=UPI001C863927|nr:hypothetical protein [Candidatus Cardinium hertigii]
MAKDIKGHSLFARAYLPKHIGRTRLWDFNKSAMFKFVLCTVKEYLRQDQVYAISKEITKLEGEQVIGQQQAVLLRKIIRKEFPDVDLFLGNEELQGNVATLSKDPIASISPSGSVHSEALSTPLVFATTANNTATSNSLNSEISITTLAPATTPISQMPQEGLTNKNVSGLSKNTESACLMETVAPNSPNIVSANAHVNNTARSFLDDIKKCDFKLKRTKP